MQTQHHAPCQLFCGRMLRPPCPPICAVGPRCCHRCLNISIHLEPAAVAHFGQYSRLALCCCFCWQRFSTSLPCGECTPMHGWRNDNFAHGTAEGALWDTQDNLAVQPIHNVMRGLAQSPNLDFWSFRQIVCEIDTSLNFKHHLPITRTTLSLWHRHTQRSVRTWRVICQKCVSENFSISAAPCSRCAEDVMS